MVLYFYLLRLNTIRRSEMAVQDNTSLIISLIVMIVPILNIIVLIALLDHLYRIRSRLREWRKDGWKYILMIKNLDKN